MMPRWRDRESRSTSRATELQPPRVHCAKGTGNPIFGRLRIDSGSNPFIASRSTRLVVSPLSFHASGSCARSEEHTSELQSRVDLVCRLLLEKKKKELTNA